MEYGCTITIPEYVFIKILDKLEGSICGYTYVCIVYSAMKARGTTYFVC